MRESGKSKCVETSRRIAGRTHHTAQTEAALRSECACGFVTLPDLAVDSGAAELSVQLAAPERVGGIITVITIKCFAPLKLLKLSDTSAWDRVSLQGTISKGSPKAKTTGPAPNCNSIRTYLFCTLALGRNLARRLMSKRLRSTPSASLTAD